MITLVGMLVLVPRAQAQDTPRLESLELRIEQLQSDLATLTLQSKASGELLEKQLLENLQTLIQESRARAEQEQQQLEQRRQFRIAQAQDTTALLTRTLDVLQTGSYDVGAALDDATERLRTLQESAAQTGGEAEAAAAAQAQISLGQVRYWLDNGDFQNAKAWLLSAGAFVQQAQQISEFRPPAQPPPDGWDSLVLP